eukprot:7206149-Prymnesium_polylepis.1
MFPRDVSISASGADFRVTAFVQVGSVATADGAEAEGAPGRGSSEASCYAEASSDKAAANARRRSSSRMRLCIGELQEET